MVFDKEAALTQRLSELSELCFSLESKLVQIKENNMNYKALLHEDFKTLRSSNPEIHETLKSFTPRLEQAKKKAKGRQLNTDYGYLHAELLDWLVKTRRDFALPIPPELAEAHQITQTWLSHMREAEEIRDKLNEIDAAQAETAKQAQKKRARRKAPVVEEPQANPLEGLERAIAKHERDLDLLQKQKSTTDSRVTEVLNQFDERLREQVEGFEGMSLEEKAASINNAIQQKKKYLDALHESLSQLSGHSAIRASGINVDSVSTSHQDGEFKYIDPVLFSNLNTARTLLQNNQVRQDSAYPAYTHLNNFNRDAEKYLGRVMPDFDPYEQEHWDQLKTIATNVYTTLELRRKLASHMSDSAALAGRIEAKKSALAKAQSEFHKKKRELKV